MTPRRYLTSAYHQKLKDMQKFKVKVTEILAKEIEIEATDRKEAHAKAEDMWFNGEIDFNVLDDHADHEIEVVEKWY